MSNDARLGLVVGVGLVLAVAVIFFRKDLITRKPAADPAASTTIHSAGPSPSAAPREMARPTRARTASQTDAPDQSTRGGVHTGEAAGETPETAASGQPAGR